MNTLANTGRRMVFWGALLLIGWAVYELAIRFEEMVTWLSPVYSLVADGKITLWDYFSRVDWSRLRTHIFLLVCAVFALYALLARKGVIAGLITVPLAVLLAIFSLGSTPLMNTNFWQKLKLIPLLLIACGNSLRFIASLQRKKAKTPPAQGQPPVRQHYDPFRINRP